MIDIFPGAAYTQLAQWGFPTQTLRPTPPPSRAFSVIHWTAGLGSAENEVAWRSDGSLARNNATFWVNRDGSVVQALGDPLGMAPWSNGDMQAPDVSNPRIAALVNEGANANFRTLLSIENTGTYGYPLTPEQEDTNAAIVAYYHAKAGLEISRETVIGHYQINSVNRPNCPGIDKSPIDRIVGKAGAIMYGVKQAGTPIGTFKFSGPGHQLISPLDVLVRYTRPDGAEFDVIAAVDLKDSNGVPVDITKTSPPRNNWDQLYLVDAPGFGIAAYVLRQDGVFTPAGPAMYSQDDMDQAVAGAVAAALPSARADAATAVAEAAVAKAEEF